MFMMFKLGQDSDGQNFPQGLNTIRLKLRMVGGIIDTFISSRDLNDMVSRDAYD